MSTAPHTETFLYVVTCHTMSFLHITRNIMLVPLEKNTFALKPVKAKKVH